MITTILLVASIVSIQAGKYPKITATDINNLRIDIRQAIDDSSFEPLNDNIQSGEQPLIGSVVRLSFHDCVGRNIKQNKGNGKDSPSGKLTDNACNGCIDFDEPDNAGLEVNAFDPLEDVYQGVTCDTRWADKMSRADFWAAAGTIALEYAAENQWRRVAPPPLDIFNARASLRDIPYYFGREDCPRSPFATEKDVFEFPQSFAGWQETFEWFQENMGFNERETVVLQAGHTLGSGRADASGFVGFWSGNPNVLDNQYLTFMTADSGVFDGSLFNAFVQSRVGDTIACQTIFADICTEEKSDLIQWVIGPNSLNGPNLIGTALFLNSDISMVWKIEDFLDRETGAVTCDIPSLITPPTGNECPLQEGIYQIVNDLAFDNAKFMDEWADAWEKMILLGQKNGGKKLQKLIVPYDRSIEQTGISADNVALKTNSVSSQTQSNIDGSGDIETVTEDNNNSGVIAGVVIGCLCLMILFGVIYRHKKRSSILQKQVKEISALLPDGATTSRK